MFFNQEAAPIKVRYADGERERLGKVERGRLVKGEREHPGNCLLFAKYAFL